MIFSNKSLNTVSLLIAAAALATPTAHAQGLFKKLIAVGVVAAGGHAIAKNASGRQNSAVVFSLEGKVIHVDDGDTVMLLLPDHQKKKIRLTDIDAPESEHGNNRPSQRYSRASRDSLASMVHGKNVRADCYDTDMYQRSVCRIYANNVDVNSEQVRRGMAWANLSYKKSVRDNSVFALHENAKSGRVGLWADQSPVEPWNWRKVCWVAQQCAQAGI